MGYSVEDAKTVAIVELCTRILDSHFVVPLPQKGGTKMGPGIYAYALMRLHELHRNLVRDENTHKVRAIHGKNDRQKDTPR